MNAMMNTDLLIDIHSGVVDENARPIDYWEKNGPQYHAIRAASKSQYSDWGAVGVAIYEFFKEEFVDYSEAIVDLGEDIGIRPDVDIEPDLWLRLNSILDGIGNGNYPNEPRAHELENEYKDAAWAEWISDDVKQHFGIEFRNWMEFRNWFDIQPFKSNAYATFDGRTSFVGRNWHVESERLVRDLNSDWIKPDWYIVWRNRDELHSNLSSATLMDSDHLVQTQIVWQSGYLVKESMVLDSIMDFWRAKSKNGPYSKPYIVRL